MRLTKITETLVRKLTNQKEKVLIHLSIFILIEAVKSACRRLDSERSKRCKVEAIIVGFCTELVFFFHSVLELLLLINFGREVLKVCWEEAFRVVVVMLMEMTGNWLMSPQGPIQNDCFQEILPANYVLKV